MIKKCNNKKGQNMQKKACPPHEEGPRSGMYTLVFNKKKVLFQSVASPGPLCQDDTEEVKSAGIPPPLPLH